MMNTEKVFVVVSTTPADDVAAGCGECNKTIPAGESSDCSKSEICQLRELDFHSCSSYGTIVDALRLVVWSTCSKRSHPYPVLTIMHSLT